MCIAIQSQLHSSHVKPLILALVIVVSTWFRGVEQEFRRGTRQRMTIALAGSSIVYMPEGHMPPFNRLGLNYTALSRYKESGCV